MSIRYQEKTGQLILETASTSYQMNIDGMGYLKHQYSKILDMETLKQHVLSFPHL